MKNNQQSILGRHRFGAAFLMPIFRKRECSYRIFEDIAYSLFDKWVWQAENSGFFHKKDNCTPGREELLKLRKENQRLKMELMKTGKQASRCRKC